jgi:hypothetical protein
MSTPNKNTSAGERDLIGEFNGYFVGEKSEEGGAGYDAGFAALQEELGVDLPAEFVNFVRRYGVHAFETRITFEDGEGHDSIQTFLGFTKKNFGAYDIITTINVLGNRLPSGFVPLALDPYGNLVCYRVENQALYFWDHERVSDPADESELTLIADSLSKFIKSLQTSGEDGA